MRRRPTRQRRRVNPEILRTFVSPVHNISSNLGSERLQRTILTSLRRSARTNSNDIASIHQYPHGTRILPSATVTVLDRPMPHPVPQISHVLQPVRQLPLARRPLQPFQQIRHRLGPCSDVCSDCNALHWTEERSRKSTRQGAKFSTCCMNGAFLLPQLPDAPVLMRELLQDESNGNYYNDV
jgi:hypothetical protein